MNFTSDPGRPSLTHMYLKALALPVLLVVIGLGYYVVNTVGVPEETAVAKVVDKRIVEPGANYHTTIVGGQAYVQSHPQDPAYLIELQVADERMGSFVPLLLYEKLSVGDQIDVRFRRTRLSQRTQMVEVIESSLRKG